MLNLLIQLVTRDYLLAWNHGLISNVKRATFLGYGEGLALVIHILILRLQCFLLLRVSLTTLFFFGEFLSFCSSRPIIGCFFGFLFGFLLLILSNLFLLFQGVF